MIIVVFATEIEAVHRKIQAKRTKDSFARRVVVSGTELAAASFGSVVLLSV
jgi:hypothetical protein